MKTPLFLLFLCLPFLTIAQCDDSVRPTSGSMGYKARGQHCEGFYRSLVSANDLQIVHFTKGRLAYSATEVEKIQLSVPVRTNSPVNVRSMGIPRNLFYQMDVMLNSGESFSWDTGEVLLRNQSTKYARMLGLLGFTESGDRRVYVPVQVNQTEEDQGFQIKLVASTTVKQLKWRLRGKTDYEAIRDGRSFTPGRAIPITLPNNLSSGEYTLEIQGKERDGVTDVTKVLRIRI
jgi:hypothetical protein